MTATNPFRKATRTALKARVALDGPSGSGKTWTALEWATVLADGAPIAVIDTEHGSAKLYSDRFDFDVFEWEPPYDPNTLAQMLRDVPTYGHAVVVCDSFSHFWEGEGGTLDIADSAGQRSGGNSFAGWKVATPALRHLIDTILASPIHVICTMRSKMEYVLEEDSRGKKVPKKVGMAPVMRQGVEYEFTLIGDLDLEHRLMISKSRCSLLADQVVQPGRAGDAAKEFKDWLNGGAALASPAVIADLTARMNALPELARKECKGEFVNRFGKPSDLLAANVEEATGLVVKYEAATPDDDPDGGQHPPPAAPDDDPGAVDPPEQVADNTADTSGAAVSPGADEGAGPAASSPAPAPNDGGLLYSGAEYSKRLRALWASIGDAWPQTTKAEKETAAENLDCLVGIVTAGRTQTTKAVTRGEWPKLLDAAAEIGRGEAALSPNGSQLLYLGQQTAGDAA